MAALGGWYVTSRRAAIAVLRDDETFTVDDPRFSTARIVGRSMLSTDGPEHARHRAPFVDAFTTASLRAPRDGLELREAIAALVARLAEPLGRGRTELRSVFAAPFAAESILLALDLTELDVDRLLGWYRAIVDAVQDADHIDTAGHAHEAYAQLAGAILDSASTVVAAALETLPPPAVASNVAVILFGAIETVEGTIANAFLHSLSHPDRAAAASAPAIVEESMRIEPAATVVHRYATRDTDLFGAAIRSGDFVSVSLAAANRDPAVFTEPDTFDPNRGNLRQHLTFATGPHACLGIHLARLEARLALEAAPALRLDAEASTPPRGLIFRKPDAVWVEPAE